MSGSGPSVLRRLGDFARKRPGGGRCTGSPASTKRRTRGRWRARRARGSAAHRPAPGEAGAGRVREAPRPRARGCGWVRGRLDERGGDGQVDRRPGAPAPAAWPSPRARTSWSEVDRRTRRAPSAVRSWVQSGDREVRGVERAGERGVSGRLGRSLAARTTAEKTAGDAGQDRLGVRAEGAELVASRSRATASSAAKASRSGRAGRASRAWRPGSGRRPRSRETRRRAPRARRQTGGRARGRAPRRGGRSGARARAAPGPLGGAAGASPASPRSASSGTAASSTRWRARRSALSVFVIARPASGMSTRTDSRVLRANLK